MTESCSCITAHPPEFYSYEHAHAVGTICASTTVKIIDPEGNELGIGEEGEVCPSLPVPQFSTNVPTLTSLTFHRS